MQEKHLYEYAVIRVVPRVEREEFVNIGVILFSKKQKYLMLKFQVNGQKLNCVCPAIEISVVEAAMQGFEKICKADKKGGPIALLDLPSRFRWLTATRSTIIQTSKVHPGMSEDLTATLNDLFSKLVL